MELSCIRYKQRNIFKVNLNTMLAFKYIFLASFIVISNEASARQDLKKIKSTHSYSSRHTVNALLLKKAIEEQTSNKDTTQPSAPRNGKYAILTFGPNPANPLKLGYFTLNNNEYKYFDIEGKLLGEGNYTYEIDEKQIKWQSGPFKSVGWEGGFEIEQEGKTHKIRLHNSTIGTNTLE